MRRSAALALFTVLAAAVASSSAAGPVVFPSYVDGQGRWEAASSNLWAAGAGKTQVLKKTTFGLPPSPGETTGYIWSSTCSPAAQKVAFTRTLDVPGAPSMLTFTFEPGVPPAEFGSASPLFKSVSLTANGKTVLSLDTRQLLVNGSQDFTAPISTLHDFKLGANRVVVTIDRAALPARQTSCHTGAGDISAAFELDAYSAADLSVTAGPPSTAPLKGSTGTIKFTTPAVLNAGPSAALPGTWMLSVGAPNLVVAVTGITASSPFGKCTVTETTSTQVSCPFDLLPAGTKASVTLTVTVGFSPGQSATQAAEITLGWSIHSIVAGIGHTPDPNSANDFKSAIFYLCPPGVSDPHCA